MVKLIEKALRIWRDRVAGPALRTYDSAVAELGGNRWREHKDTDAWFIGEPPSGPPPLPFDMSIPLLIARRTLQPALVLGGSAALLVLIAIGTVAARSGATAGAATLPATAAAAPALLAAPAVAPPTAPVAHVEPRLVASTAKSSAPVAPRTVSPSVRALFAGGAVAGHSKAKVVAKHTPAKKSKKQAGRAGKRRHR